MILPVEGDLYLYEVSSKTDRGIVERLCSALEIVSIEFSFTKYFLLTWIDRLKTFLDTFQIIDIVDYQ